MRVKMSDKSLFALLLRSPAWVSGAIAVAIALAARALIPAPYALPLGSAALPFAAIACMAAWRQWRQPTAKRVAAIRGAVEAMGWPAFSSCLEASFRRQGYAVTPLSGAADFRLEKDGKRTLVCARRWKAARHGVEAVRDLTQLRASSGADEALYVALAELTPQAAAHAASQHVRVLGDQELAVLVRL